MNILKWFPNATYTVLHVKETVSHKMEDENIILHPKPDTTIIYCDDARGNIILAPILELDKPKSTS